ncbi:helix-turn-helix domain-containing protein [Bifidobacterium sp. ESL0704]|uniref:helix-turn-helix domain-containing protein n=1 Tax=Bifidobacterium sp. ESL0704 TaxID=2983219 RepID=UPI0023F97D39|nr:helix-turn-helix domain-containing protein [Bifidobacterium sp. ESL0704]WEV52957.1 helix-turn-helix domain-containing protein [Bifidobacterium sp. ESL0704]
MSKERTNRKQVGRLLASKPEAADMLGISEATLERLSRKGAIAVVQVPSTGKVGRPRNMYAVADIQHFIDSQRVYLDETTDVRKSRPNRSHSRKPRRSAVEALRKAGVR